MSAELQSTATNNTNPYVNIPPTTRYVHVAFISPDAYSASVQYPARIATELKSLDIDITVIIPDTEESRRLLDESIASYYSPDLGKGRKFIQIYTKLLNLSPDIVHYPFFGNLSTLLLSVFTLPTRIPHVATLHDPTPHSGMTREIAGVEIRGLSRRMVATKFDKILVHGPESLREAMEHGYPESRLHTIPHGLYDHFPRDPSTAVEEDTILFFGHIRPNKGYDRIPDILDIVQSEVPKIRAIVAGPPAGPSVDAKEIGRVIDKLESDSRISVRAEYVPDDAVSKLFEKSKLVVLPYYDGTMSGVLLTAYHFETPVVVTDVGDIGPTVREDGSGFVVEAKDTNAIGESICRILKSPSTYIRLVDNIKRNNRKYQWETICEEIVSIYMSLLRD